VLSHLLKSKNGAQERDETWQIHDQLQVLIAEYILPFTQKTIDPIFDFRDRQLIQMRDVSVLIEANFRGIALLFNQYKTKGFEKQFTMQSLKDIMTETRLGMRFPEELYCFLFAASKMTVVNEAKESADHYHLDLIEFQVLLCLLAKTYFDQDMGMKEPAVSGEDLEIYEHVIGHNDAFSSEKLLFFFRNLGLFELVSVSCYDFEDIKS
jgi:hypothetical protein